jgi:peptidoglycan/LPS O-acetylase OafA/YrhL
MAGAVEMETRRGPTLGQRRELDGIRGVAIAMVILHHLYAPVFSGADTGVDLFFVLSGFLITKLALEERDRRGGLSLGAFFTRRAFRILPPLVVMLVTFLALSATWLDDIGRDMRTEIAFAAVAAGNLVPVINGPVDEPVLAHTWSLGVEEQFYFLWPLVLVAVWRIRRSLVALERTLLIGAALAFLLGRGVLHGIVGYEHWASLPYMNSDGLMAGAALAVRYHRGAPLLPAVSDRWARRLPWAALGVLGADVLLAGRYIEADGFLIRMLVVRACWYVVMASVVDRGFDPLGALRSWPVGALGRISYSVYLWHAPVFLVLTTARFPEVRLPILVALRLVVGIGLGIVSYHVVERPMLRLGRRIVANRWGARTAPAPPEPRVVGSGVVIDLTDGAIAGAAGLAADPLRTG